MNANVRDRGRAIRFTSDASRAVHLCVYVHANARHGILRVRRE